MVLESQRVRPSIRYSSTGKRRRRRGRWRYVMGLLVVAGGLYLGIRMFSGNGKPERPGPTGQADGQGPTGGQPGPGDVAQGTGSRQGPEGAAASMSGQAGHPLLGGSGAEAGQGPTAVEQAGTGTPDSGGQAAGPSEGVGPGARQGDVSRPEPAVAQSSVEVVDLIQRGRQQAQAGHLVQARSLLNAALRGSISDTDARVVRQELAALNEQLIFSQRIFPDDPLVAVFVTTAEKYQLSKIAPAYDVPWELIQRVNRIDPRRIRVGQRLKIPKGPFHMVIVKHDFRADLYAEGPDGPVYIRSFRVGLGADDSTPVGRFEVRRNSKLKNPRWVNPRTGKVYDANDPANPIGERWIGLAGIDEQTRVMSGYGLHGTIEPQSIGTQASMGCIRFLPDDIALVYDLLIPFKSKVTIQP